MSAAAPKIGEQGASRQVHLRVWGLGFRDAGFLVRGLRFPPEDLAFHGAGGLNRLTSVDMLHET